MCYIYIYIYIAQTSIKTKTIYGYTILSSTNKKQRNYEKYKVKNESWNRFCFSWKLNLKFREVILYEIGYELKWKLPLYVLKNCVEDIDFK